MGMTATRRISVWATSSEAEENGEPALELEGPRNGEGRMMNPKLREALEAALIENPDDVAAHMAYADLLSEDDDPRGEFIQVQLALEDEKLPVRERKQLERRERELLTENFRD